MPPEPGGTTDSLRRERASRIVFFGMILFAAAFVGFATWLGKQDRARYRITPEPPLAPAAQRIATALGTWRPIWPRAPETAAGSATAALVARIRDGRATLEDALPDFEAARSEDAAAPAAFNLALALLAARRPMEALKVLREGEAAGTASDATRLLLVGMALEGTREAPQALAAYQSALSADPGLSEARFRAARILLATHRAVDALREIQAVTSLSPAWADAQRLLADTCLATGDYARAKRAFLDVLQLCPEDARAKAEVKRLDGS